MAEPTYFLRNCAIVFGWIFHRLCKSLRPCNVLYESLRSTFLRAITILFAQSDFSCLEFSYYLLAKLIFTKYSRSRQGLRRFDIVLPFRAN